MDLSCGATFTFTIGPNLPQFTFKIAPEVREPVDGFPASTVRDIEVFRGDRREPSQRLTGCDFTEMEPPPRAETDPPWFRTEDINFDGYKDIFVLTSWGATGSQNGCIWLYNPSTGRFDYSKEFSGLARHWLDPATKTILSFENGGMAGTVYNARKYEVEENRPVLIYSEDQDYDIGKKQYHCIVRERRVNAMVTLRDQWANDPPCNAEGLMQQYAYPRRMTTPGTTVRVIG